MTKAQDELKNEDLINEELQDLEEELDDDINESFSEDECNFPNTIKSLESEIENLKDLLARKQADYLNLSARVEREKEEMTFYTTSKIATKFLGTVDNMERMLEATPEEERESPLYKAVLSTYKTLTKELDSIWIKPFESIGQEVDPNRHDVMTQAPWELDIIVSEFEKGYELNWRVVRHAKVVSGLWN